MSRKSCLAHVEDRKLQKRFDTIRYHAYTKPCVKFQTLEMTAAYMAEGCERRVTIP
jgi:hypothetical protein